jgi:hypothetical protein
MATPLQEALFREHYQPRTDGGPDYTADDYLKQIKLADKVGIRDETLASAQRVPVTLIRSLRATLKEK